MDSKQGNRHSTRIVTDILYPEIEAIGFGLVLSLPPFSTRYLTITLGYALQLWSESMKTSGLEQYKQNKTQNGQKPKREKLEHITLSV